MMQGSAPGVVPEDVLRPFRPAAFRAAVPVGSSSASVGGVLGSGLLMESGWGQGQYCGHVYIFPNSLTVPAGTP